MIQTRRLLRNDLAPLPKVQITEGGSSYSLDGAGIAFAMWSETTLSADIDDSVLTLTVPSSAFTDEFFEVGLEVLIDRERMTVAAPLPAWPYTGVLTITVTRAGDKEAHASGTKVKFFVVEAAGAASTPPGTDGIAEYVWQAVDTNQAGTYVCQFEITPAVGGKFTVPVSDTYQIEILADGDDK